MIYRHAIGQHVFVFDDLRDLLAKATPPRSGDRLAGIAAAERRADDRGADGAGRSCRCEQFLHEAVIPYEDDEVTRLIVDSHDDAGLCADRRR